MCLSLQFLLIFRKAAAGELAEDSGLFDLYKNMDEIDVDVEGVKGAKNFFQAKVYFFLSFFLLLQFLATEQELRFRSQSSSTSVLENLLSW